MVWVALVRVWENALAKKVDKESEAQIVETSRMNSMTGRDQGGTQRKQSRLVTRLNPKMLAMDMKILKALMEMKEYDREFPEGQCSPPRRRDASTGARIYHIAHGVVPVLWANAQTRPARR